MNESGEGQEAGSGDEGVADRIQEELEEVERIEGETKRLADGPTSPGEAQVSMSKREEVDLAEGSQESNLQVAEEALQGLGSRGSREAAVEESESRLGKQQAPSADVGKAEEAESSQNADAPPSLSPSQADGGPSGSPTPAEYQPAKTTEPDRGAQSEAQRAQALCGEEERIPGEPTGMTQSPRHGRAQGLKDAATSAEAGSSQQACATAKTGTHVPEIVGSSQVEPGAGDAGALLHTKILESSAPSWKEASGAQLDPSDGNHGQAAQQIEIQPERRFKKTQFWSVGRSKPVIGNNLHPFPAQKALKNDMLSRLSTGLRRQNQAKNASEAPIKSGRRAQGSAHSGGRNLNINMSLTKNLQVRKISLCDPSATPQAEAAKNEVAEPVKQDSSGRIGLMNEAEQPLAEKSSDRFGGSSGTGQQSPKLASTLDPAGRQGPGHGNTSCRQPISGLLIPAPDFLCYGTPEKSQEILVADDVPLTIFGISHHDIGKHRLHSGELYLAQNSSRSNTQTRNTPLVHRATEVHLGVAKNERRNVTPHALKASQRATPSPHTEAMAAGASATLPTTNVRGTQRDKVKASAMNQSPRATGDKNRAREKPAHKELPGPFQKINTQRLKQMLTNRGGNVRKATNANVVAKEHAVAGAGAATAGLPRRGNQMMVAPSPLLIERSKIQQSGASPESARGFGAAGASSLPQAAKDGARDASSGHAGLGLAVQQSPRTQQPIDGLKPTRIIEKIQLKAISAERKRNLHDKLELQKFKLRLSKMQRMNAQATPCGYAEGRISLLEVVEGSEAGQENVPGIRTYGLHVTKQSPRRTANLPARDSPEQSEVSMSSTRKPDRIERSTLVAKQSIKNDIDGQKMQGPRATRGEDSAAWKQVKLNAFKMEAPDVEQLETPRAGQDLENLRSSVNRLTKTKGRHSEKDSPSLFCRSSKAQDVSAGQTARNRHETEEHELGHLSGAIDIQSQPFDNDYSIMPFGMSKTNEENPNSATFQSASRVPEPKPTSSRRTDPMLLYWNQNNAFLKQRKPGRGAGQRGTRVFCQGHHLAMKSAALAPGQSSGRDGLPHGTRQTDSKDTVLHKVLSPEPSNQRHLSNEHRSVTAPGSTVSAHPSGAPAGQATSSASRAAALVAPMGPPEQLKNQTRPGKIDKILEKSSSRKDRGEEAPGRPSLSMKQANAARRMGAPAVSLAFSVPMQVITVPKASEEQHKSPATHIQESELEVTAHSEALSPTSPQRLVAVDLQTGLPEPQKKEFKLSMVEINKKERKDGREEEQRPESPEEPATSAAAPMLQEFGPLKTCAFPIDPEYQDIDAKEQSGRLRAMFHKKSRSVAPGVSRGASGAARATLEDERIIHTQLIPTSYPIPAATLLEKRSTGSRPHSKAQASTLDAPGHLLGFGAPPGQHDDPRMSPRLQQMKATPKFKHNERQRVKNQLQTSMDKQELQEMEKLKAPNQNHQVMEWFKPFPSNHARDDRDCPQEAHGRPGRPWQPGQANLEQTQLKVKEYWLPLGQMPQDREYIEVLDDIFSSLMVGQQLDANELQESSFFDGVALKAVDTDLLAAERQPGAPSPWTVPRIGAATLFEPQRRNSKVHDLESSLTPGLLGNGGTSGMSAHERVQGRLKPPLTAEYQTGERTGPIRATERQHQLLYGRGQPVRPAEASMSNPSIHNAEVTGASSHYQGAETREAPSSRGRTPGMQSAERGSRQQPRSSYKTQRPLNTMKTIIQTNKSADDDQSVEGDKNKSHQARQPTTRQACASEQPDYHMKLTEKSKDQQLITNVVEQLVQTKKLTEKLQQIKRKQEEINNNAAKRSLLPFFAPQSAAEANYSARGGSRQHWTAGLNSQSRTLQAASAIDRVLQHTQLDAELRAALASGGSNTSARSRDPSKIGGGYPWISHARAATQPAQQPSSLGRPAGASFALSALGEMLSTSLKSQLKNPFTNEAIVSINGTKTAPPEQQRLPEQSYRSANPTRGQTPNPRSVLHQRLPSLGPRAPSRCPGDGGQTKRSQFTASTGRRGQADSNARGHPMVGKRKLEALARMPDTCSVKIQHPQLSAQQQKILIVRGTSRGQRQVQVDTIEGPASRTLSPWELQHLQQRNEGSPSTLTSQREATKRQSDGQRSQRASRAHDERVAGGHKQQAQKDDPADDGRRPDGDGGPATDADPDSRPTTSPKPSPRADLGLKPHAKELKIDKHVLGSNKYYQPAPKPEGHAHRVVDQRRRPANGQSIHFKLEQQPMPHQVSSKSLLLSYQQGIASPHAGKLEKDGDSATIVKRASMGSQMNSLSSRKECQKLSSRRSGPHNSSHQINTGADGQRRHAVQVQQLNKPKDDPHEMSAMAIQTDFEDYPALDKADLGDAQGSPGDVREAAGAASKNARQNSSTQLNVQHQKSTTAQPAVRIEDAAAGQPSRNIISTNTFARASKAALDQAMELCLQPNDKTGGKPRAPMQTIALVQVPPVLAEERLVVPRAKEDTRPLASSPHGSAQFPTRSNPADDDLLDKAGQRGLQQILQQDPTTGRPSVLLIGSSYSFKGGQKNSADTWTRRKPPPDVPKLELSKLLGGASGNELQPQGLKSSRISAHVSARAAWKVSAEASHGSAASNPHTLADPAAHPQALGLLLAGVPAGYSIYEFERRTSTTIKGRAGGGAPSSFRAGGGPPGTQKLATAAGTKMKKHRSFWRQMHHGRGPTSVNHALKVGDQSLKLQAKRIPAVLEASQGSVDGPSSSLQAPEPSLIQAMQNIDNPQFVRMHQELFDQIQLPKNQAAGATRINQPRLRTVVMTQRGTRPLASPRPATHAPDEPTWQPATSPTPQPEATPGTIPETVSSLKAKSALAQQGEDLAAIKILGKKIDQREQALVAQDSFGDEAYEDLEDLAGVFVQLPTNQSASHHATRGSRSDTRIQPSQRHQGPQGHWPNQRELRAHDVAAGPRRDPEPVAYGGGPNWQMMNQASAMSITRHKSGSVGPESPRGTASKAVGDRVSLEIQGRLAVGHPQIAGDLENEDLAAEIGTQLNIRRRNRAEPVDQGSPTPDANLDAVPYAQKEEPLLVD